MSTRILVLFLILEIHNGYSIPQGFLPKLASWNNKERSLTLLPNIQIDSPIKSPLVNIFGKKNTIDYPKKPQNNEYPIITDKVKKGSGETKSSQGLLTTVVNGTENKKEEKKIQHTNGIIPKVSKEDEEYISKLFCTGIEYATDNQIDDTEATSETSTDDYETTTFEGEILNRANNPHLVASILG